MPEIPLHFYAGMPEPPPGWGRIVMDYPPGDVQVIAWRADQDEIHTLRPPFTVRDGVLWHKLVQIGDGGAAHGFLRKLIMPSGAQADPFAFREDIQGSQALYLPNDRRQIGGQ